MGVDWGGRADAAHAVLETYRQPNGSLYQQARGRPIRRFGTWNMWWQAHALDALNDAYVRTGSEQFTHRADDLLDAILARTHGRGVNKFYDDMGWLAMATLRISGTRPDHDRAAALARSLLLVIRSGWSDVGGGGVAWATDHPHFKNLPATGPAAILALRIGAQDRDDSLVAWGLAALHWIESTLVASDVVSDGITVTDTVALVSSEYTYNYGLLISAYVAAHHATNDPSMLDRGQSIARSALQRMSDPDTGVWRAEGSGDGGLFKGILARGLADLVTKAPDGEVARSIENNAATVWAGAAAGPVRGTWGTAADPSADLSEHLSGVLLYEQRARIVGYA